MKFDRNKSWKSLLLFGLVFQIIFALPSFSSQTTVKNKAPVFEAVPGEFIVGFKNNPGFLSAQFEMKSNISRLFGANEILSVETVPTSRHVQKIKIRNSKLLSKIMEATRALPQVKYVEPNYIYRAFGVPNDPDFAKQWDMYNTGQADRVTPPSEGEEDQGAETTQNGNVGSDINVMPLWNKGITGSRDILVAIIDTGVDYNHPDLKENIFTNPNEIPANGIDDDGNGVVDDVHGANFTTAVPKGNGLDDNNHGTHCAGTIGAAGNNGVGIAGVNWEVSILPVKFLTASGSGSLDNALRSIDYARKMGAKVMSNSWGGGGFSQALYDAIKDARDAGILFVAAAGNETNDNDASPTYPASYELDNIVSVAAIDNRDQLAYFSNYGKAKVHVAAPGVNIYSTVINGKYDTYSGTSMACPHVSGMAALLWSTDRSLTYTDIKDRLIKTSTPIRGLKNVSVSHGRVNMENLYNNFTPPSNEPDESAWVKRSYSLESGHPYDNNANQVYSISFPGAKFIRVIFEKFETENKYDKVQIETPQGDVIESVSGSKNGYKTDYVEGDQINLRLVSDFSMNAYGFKISEIEIIK